MASWGGEAKGPRERSERGNALRFHSLNSPPYLSLRRRQGRDWGCVRGQEVREGKHGRGGATAITHPFCPRGGWPRRPWHPLHAVQAAGG